MKPLVHEKKPGCSLYISGPMTGLPEHNRPTFQEAYEHMSRIEVFDAVNSPHKILPPVDGEGDWAWYMSRAVTMQMGCNVWGGLPGWHKSKGAKREFDLAVDLGHELFLFKRQGGFWKLEELV